MCHKSWYSILPRNRYDIIMSRPDWVRWLYDWKTLSCCLGGGELEHKLATAWQTTGDREQVTSHRIVCMLHQPTVLNKWHFPLLHPSLSHRSKDWPVLRYHLLGNWDSHNAWDIHINACMKTKHTHTQRHTHVHRYTHRHTHNTTDTTTTKW